MKAMLKGLMKIFLLWSGKKLLRFMVTPHALMACLLLSVVACDSARNTWDTVTFSNASPYGGTDRPSRVKIGKPYAIAGRRYQPSYSESYREIGEASWYGPGFDGRKTANGERFDEDDMTAAHRTLPMPSMVRVKRRDTGESIVVRINDRGPFAHDRIIDLSRAAAEELDMIGSGVAEVELTYLPEETLAYLTDNDIPVPAYMSRQDHLARMVQATPVPVAKPDAGNAAFAMQRGSSVESDRLQRRFRVQTASFADEERARKHARLLKTIAPAEIIPANVEGKPYYRVMTPAVTSYNEATTLLRQTHELGYTEARIMVE